MDPSCFIQGVAQIKCLESLFETIITIATSLAGLLFFVMIVVGGLRCLFSGGNPKAVEACKGIITSATVGLVLVVSAYLILTIISSFTGINLTVFKITGF